MADTKITALTELAEAPASGDLLTVVDVSDTTMSANGTNKKIQFSNLAIVGTIQMYGGSAAPTGYVLCDGASLLRAGTYAALFDVLGTTYGSADGTHFNVPDLRGRVPVGVGTGTGGGSSGTGLPSGGSALTARARADWLGEETHVLTTGELAAHSHGTNITSSTTSTGMPATLGSADAAGEITSDSVGSSTAHNTMQPVMAVNFIIKY